MWRIRIIPKPPGVSIVDMETLLPLSDDPIEVVWRNTDREIEILSRYRQRDATLIVESLALMEKTANSLGLPYVLDDALVKQGALALSKESLDWRKFVDQQGRDASRCILAKGLANKLREGKDPREARRVLREAILNNVSPSDLDVLLTLRSMCRNDA